MRNTSFSFPSSPLPLNPLLFNARLQMSHIIHADSVGLTPVPLGRHWQQAAILAAVSLLKSNYPHDFINGEAANELCLLIHARLMQ